MARTLTRPMFRKGGMAQREEYMGGGITTPRIKRMGGGMTGIMSGIVPDAGLTPRTGYRTGSAYDPRPVAPKTEEELLQEKIEAYTPKNYKKIADIIESDIDFSTGLPKSIPFPESTGLSFPKDIEAMGADTEVVLPKSKKESKKTITSKLEDTPSDKETVKDYIDMFKSALGDEEDSEKRNKYLALAQFGANLLSQPGGDLVGAVGKASTPAIQTLGKAMSDRRDAERQAKLLGTQAYLKSIEPGALRKQINDLMALGYTKQGAITKIVDEGRGTATRESTQVTKRENLAKELNEEGIPPRQAGVIAGKILASKVADYNYSLLPDDPVEGEYYYNKKGDVGKYVIKNGVAGLDDGKE